MKTSLFKKIIAITLSLTLIISCMMIAAPYVQAADSIDFLMDGNKRAGIKQITIDGTTYYDIDGGKSSIDIDTITPVEFYKKAMTADYNGQSAVDMWANIASVIFENAGTDHGYNDNGFSDNFDGFFVNDTNNESDINLIQELGETNAHKHGRAKTTGWGISTTLKDTQSKMAREIATSFDDVGKENVSSSTVLKFSTGSSDGFKILNDTTNQTVLYNIVTTSKYNGGNNKGYYSSFGLIFYDFELTPLADDDLAFITAAEGYESLEAADAANVPGVEYNESGNGTPNTSYISNPSSSDTTVSASYSETSSTTVSNYMESSETYTFGQTTEVSTEFGASFPLVADSKMSISMGFSSEQAISTAYGSEESITKETTVETVAEVNLPAHTQIGISQQSGKTEMVFTYDCPVYLTYKTIIVAMNGEFYLDSVTTQSWSTAGYDQGGMCIGFGTDNTTGGMTGVDNLYNRAIKFNGMDGFEASYGNCQGYWEKHGDGGSSRGYSSVPWSSILNEKQANGADLTVKECIQRLKSATPLSASGGKMSIMSTSMSTDITSIMPLYDLDYVQADGSSVYTIAPGGTIDFSKIATLGYNEYNVPYYGYISDGGSWVLCDADGNELTDVDGVTLTDVGNYQKLTADKIGTYYAKFLIDETLYSKVDGSGKIANTDLSSTAIVTINVTETGLDHICTEGPWQTTVAATCTTEGEQHANCVTCGRVMYTQTVAKLDHIPVTITTPATCTSEGKITKICGTCLGLISSETIGKLEHNEGVWKIDFEATADHNGQMSRYCTACNTALESKEFTLHTHVLGYESIIRPATCTEYGEKGLFCSICNVMFASEQIEKYGHGASIAVTSIQPTCIQPGEEKLHCEKCGELVGTNEIPAHGHVEGKWEITAEPTCTEEGLKQQTCALCDALLGEPVVIEAHEHDEGAWVTILEADCETDGEKVKECTICEGALETEVIPALGHDGGVWVTAVEASCEKAGEDHKKCTRCENVIESRAVEKLGHTYGECEIVTEASCVLNGAKQQSCSSCGMLLASETIDAHGHAAAWITVKEASCSEVGREENTCTICDSVLETREIAKTEHVPGKWEITSEPTCTNDGLKQQTCALCGTLIGEPVVIDAHDHDNGAWRTVIEATCTTDGEKVKECTVCKGTLETEVISALGHDEGVWVTSLEATCETAGEEHKTCTRCGTLIDSRRVDPLGHTPGPEMTCVTDQVCLVCEEVLVPADGKSHVWTEWETYEEAKFFVEEKQRRVCTSCDLEEYRYVKGTSKCHQYFPHCDGSGEDCWACETLSNSNGFFRNLGKFLVWFFFENIITNILFPFAHGHFHEMINLEEIFGS